MFETRARDAMGRVGKFTVGEHRLETPLILPVINPNSDLISAKEIGSIGFVAVIANSYIIFRNDLLREEALSKGVHGLIGFDGAVMTDSGSYQLSKYGEVEIGPDEIVEFQEAIGSDIGVILDIPTPPDVSHTRAERELEETLTRAKAAVPLRKKMLLAGTVQGSTHLDLREKSAQEMAKLDFDLYPIGGVVPLMESYRFADLARVIIHSKRFIPADKPVHLFGAGHPMMFALAASLGCDIFDSAAYFLYARGGRYITPTGTMKLDEMSTLPCQCPICSTHSLERLKKSNDQTRLLALHNLHITYQEIKIVKEAIWSGGLWELVEQRCRAHPGLLDALRILKDYPLERHEPLSKPAAFFYSGPESLHRPEVKRHQKWLPRIQSTAKKLVLISSSRKIRQKSNFGSNEEYHVCYVSPVFGIIPFEIEEVEVYPLRQHIHPENLDGCQIAMMQREVRRYATGFDEVFIDEELGYLGIDGGDARGLVVEISTEVKIHALGDYQFGAGAGEVMFRGCSGKYARNGRLRQIFYGEVLVAAVRASDGIIVPALEGAKRLLKLPPPRNRVVVEDEEVCRFISEGKSVFAKFITGCDPEIVPRSEVIVVEGSDELVGWGRSLLEARELLAFKFGVGVKTRGSIKKE
jgi:7-cyano-7-deazaguanine tRNA-ribosyltransferase